MEFIQNRVLSVTPNSVEVLISEIEKFDLDGPLSANGSPLYLMFRQPLSSLLANFLSNNYSINHDSLRNIIHTEWNKIVADISLKNYCNMLRARLDILLSDRAKWVKSAAYQFETVDILNFLNPQKAAPFKMRLFKLYGDYVEHTLTKNLNEDIDDTTT